VTRLRRPARVHLVRHGEVENPGGVVYGALPGFGLSARGQAQARAAAAHLAGLVDGAAAVVSSPLQRAQETAAILSAGLGGGTIATDPTLTEAGAFLEGLPRRFAPLSYLRRMLDAGARSRLESPRHILGRMHAAVLAATETTSQRDIVIVSHQFPIRMATISFEHPGAVARALPWLFIRRRCEPASVTSLDFAPDALAVSYWAPA
jgi:broad specificity phosphatase PhoE